MRIVSPARSTDAVLAQLAGEPAVATLAVERGAAVKPPGDVVVCEVAPERANAVVESLEALGIDREGAITLLQIDALVSTAATEARRAAPGHGADALLWNRIVEDAREESRLSVTFVALMCISALIATVGIILDSEVLIIGAMIVGPEFGAVAAVAVGLVRRSHFALQAVGTLATGIAFAIATAAVVTLIARAAGEPESALQPVDRFFTAFVTDVNWYSPVVALAAGVAGMIALGQGRSTALPGVLVSVTTIPAAAAIGVDLAIGHGDDMWQAGAQLVINLGALALGAVATLVVHDRGWRLVETERWRRRLP
jgi:uncharacterized hydrophobic protein (TIGR00271 family)